MPAEPTTANLLAAASYGITGRLEQLMAAMRLLDELHGARCLDPADLGSADTRCKTCRTSSGKPAPWPCLTWIRFAEVFGMAMEPETADLFRAIGRWLNGGSKPDLLKLTSRLTTPAIEQGE